MVLVNGSLIDLPSPSRLSYFWNYGSLLGVFLVVQIISGLFLSFHFRSEVNLSFFRVLHVMRDVNYGWLVRTVHANGARVFFLLIYIHIGRGMYYGSYCHDKVWFRGVSIFLISIATAFLGYVLPWGQMSFWAATVITNLLSAIPYVGVILVEWIWGGFAVGNPTLIRFFSFHFILPFVILFFVILHLFFLHEKGSRNPLGLFGNCDKIVFHPYYRIKDIYGIFLFFIFFLFICLLFPYIFIDVENFIFFNPLITPVHIQPEWYFLFAYAILRSVSSKIGGVIALIMSVFVFYLFPFFLKYRFQRMFSYLFVKMIFWYFVVNWILLTWIGACVIEAPYIILRIHFRVFYYSLFVIFWLFYEIQDYIVLWF